MIHRSQYLLNVLLTYEMVSVEELAFITVYFATQIKKIVEVRYGGSHLQF
jgi:hypothetical protein